MPTSLSLQDLNLLRKKNNSNNFPRPSSRSRSRTNSEHEQQLLEDADGTAAAVDIEEEVVDDGGEEAVGVKHVQVFSQYAALVGDEASGILAGIPVPEMESEQIIVESEQTDDQQKQVNATRVDESANNWTDQDLSKVKAQAVDEQQEIEQHINVDVEEGEEVTGCSASLIDPPLFAASSIGVYEFSTEFLAIARRHRLQPKAKAILLDLLQRTMPEQNKCPQTVAEMRKLVACDERTHKGWFGTCPGTPLPSSSKNPTQIRPQSHYLLPFMDQQPSTSRSSDPNKSSRTNMEQRYYMPTVANEFLCEDQYDEGEFLDGHIPGGPGISYYQTEEIVPDAEALMPHILQTINRLSQEVSMLRSNLQSHTPYGTIRKAKRRSVFSDGRMGLHIYDTNDNKVLMTEVSHEELRNSIDGSRNDENRLIYGPSDITELVLEKIDLSPYLHNPSLCGRMVADVLFSPEFLADKHILAEGQMSSRARLEILPAEMTRLFYDTLRKLGVSRIAEEDQEHWLYLARDGVNQRARDLKANRKRKFYVDEHEQPLFKEDQT